MIDLLALCRVCRGNGHDVGFLFAAGGSLERYLRVRAGARREPLASWRTWAAGGPRRVVVRGDDLGRVVTGASRPRVGEVF